MVPKHRTLHMNTVERQWETKVMKPKTEVTQKKNNGKGTETTKSDLSM